MKDWGQPLCFQFLIANSKGSCVVRLLVASTSCYGRKLQITTEEYKKVFVTFLTTNFWINFTVYFMSYHYKVVFIGFYPLHWSETKVIVQNPGNSEKKKGFMSHCGYRSFCKSQLPLLGLKANDQSKRVHLCWRNRNLFYFQKRVIWLFNGDNYHKFQQRG